MNLDELSSKYLVRAQWRFSSAGGVLALDLRRQI